MVDAYVVVESERQFETTIRANCPIRNLNLADGDAAGQSSRVAANAVVGDFQVVIPAMGEDAAAALAAVGEGDAVNTRRAAEEVVG